MTSATTEFGTEASQPDRVLLVDDNPTNLQVLYQTLQSVNGIELLVAKSGEEALRLATDAQPELILLDIMMPGIDGYETCRRLKADEATREASVIFTSALSETQDKVKGLELGAVDYITKPFQAAEVVARVNTHLSVHNLRAALAERNRQLEAANERMRRELAAATRVQRSLLPPAAPAARGVHFGWRYDPCEALGGDLLNVFRLDRDHVALYVADVSGHGTGPALISAAVHRSLAARDGEGSLVVRSADDDVPGVTPPAEVIKRLNAIYPMSANGGHFLTIVYAVLDLRSHVLRYGCAGHPGPVFARAGEPACALHLPALPIGVVADAEYDERSLQLAPGDRLFLYSDGLLEARGSSGRVFGDERLGAAVDSLADQSIEQALDAIIAAAAAWQDRDAFDDDVSILALEIGRG